MSAEEKFKLSKEPGFMHRVIEVVIASVASAAVSALTAMVLVAWRGGALVSQFQAQLTNLDVRVSVLERGTSANEAMDSAQQVAIATASTQNTEVQRRLDRIEQKQDETSHKLDTVLGRLERR